MTKLISTYARSSGLQIDPRGPNVKELYFPLPFDRYITLQTGSAQAVKCYDLWPEVMRLILPILTANKITVVQLGAAEDVPIGGAYDLRGKTSILQSNYLARKAILHAGNDSWLVHCAAYHRRPVVALYGTTDPGPHGPYWCDPTVTSLIVSHRCNGRPTYGGDQPNAKTVNLIPPEHVANEILRLLGVSDRFTHQSRFWGGLFGHTILDLVPDSVPHPSFLPDAVINVRMDFMHNEQTLAAVLRAGRKINLITAQPIVDVNILTNHRDQILSYNHEFRTRDESGKPLDGSLYPSADYIFSIKTLFPQSAFFTKESDEKVLSELRYRYLDICMIERTVDTGQSDYLAATLVYLNREDTPENRLALSSEATYGVGSIKSGENANPLKLKTGLFLRSNKAILSQGLAYASLAHLRAKEPMQVLGEEVRVIDDPDLWRDLHHYAIHYQV